MASTIDLTFPTSIQPCESTPFTLTNIPQGASWSAFFVGSATAPSNYGYWWTSTSPASSQQSVTFDVILPWPAGTQISVGWEVDFGSGQSQKGSPTFTLASGSGGGCVVNGVQHGTALVAGSTSNMKIDTPSSPTPECSDVTLSVSGGVLPIDFGIYTVNDPVAVTLWTPEGNNTVIFKVPFPAGTVWRYWAYDSTNTRLDSGEITVSSSSNTDCLIAPPPPAKPAPILTPNPPVSIPGSIPSAPSVPAGSSSFPPSSSSLKPDGPIPTYPLTSGTAIASQSATVQSGSTSLPGSSSQQSPQSDLSHSSAAPAGGIAAGIVIGALVIIAVLLLIFLRLRRRQTLRAMVSPSQISSFPLQLAVYEPESSFHSTGGGGGTWESTQYYQDNTAPYRVTLPRKGEFPPPSVGNGYQMSIPVSNVASTVPPSSQNSPSVQGSTSDAGYDTPPSYEDDRWKTAVRI